MSTEKLGYQLDYSLHGTISVGVAIPVEWIDEDENIDPKHLKEVNEMGMNAVREAMAGATDAVRWQVEKT